MDHQSPSNFAAAEISTWRIHDRALVLHTECVLPDKVRLVVDATLIPREDGSALVKYRVTASTLEPDSLVSYADDFTTSDFRQAKICADAILTERCNAALDEIRAANVSRSEVH